MDRSRVGEKEKIMQSKDDIEIWYKNVDPWKYRTNPDDIYRKERLLNFLDKNYENALDIGAGEGFITESLPAKNICAIELSDLAASRFSDNITRIDVPLKKYDLVLSTGTLYKQYDYNQMLEWIIQAASHHVLISGIKSWLIDFDHGKLIKREEFKYREYIQEMSLYEISA